MHSLCIYIIIYLHLCQMEDIKVEKLEKLRDYLNNLLEKDGTCLCQGEVLAVSQSLDKLLNDWSALEASGY